MQAENCVYVYVYVCVCVNNFNVYFLQDSAALYDLVFKLMKALHAGMYNVHEIYMYIHE